MSFFSLNSMKFQLSFDMLLNTKNHFWKRSEKSKFTKHIHFQSTLKWSCWKAHFIAVLMKKTLFDSVCMLRHNCLLKRFSQKILSSRSHVHWKKKLTSHFIQFLKVIFGFLKKNLKKSVSLINLECILKKNYISILNNFWLFFSSLNIQSTWLFEITNFSHSNFWDGGHPTFGF